MRVHPINMKIDSDGFFENTPASIDLGRGDDEWSATYTNALGYVDSLFRFGDGVLDASVVMVKQTTSIRATC